MAKMPFGIRSSCSKRSGLLRHRVKWAIAVLSLFSKAGAVYDLSATMTLDAPYEQPSRAPQSAADSDLAQRLAQAEIVISGMVLATTRFASQRPGLISEHDPDWWQATIEVESVEKGKVTTKTVPVLFANSTDIAWYRSPKIKKGERGVWLLHNRDTFGRAVPGLAVVQPADKQPITELAKVRALLKNAAKQ